MDHAITLRDVLGGLSLATVMVGVIIFMNGAFANPETGESDGLTCRKGCIIVVIGAAAFAALAWELF